MAISIISTETTVELTVPQGRTWRVLAISELSIVTGESIRITYGTPDGQQALYHKDARTDSTNGLSFSAAIGAPDSETEATLTQPLPDIMLPSGAKVFVEHSEASQAPPKAVTLLIED